MSFFRLGNSVQSLERGVLKAAARGRNGFSTCWAVLLGLGCQHSSFLTSMSSSSSGRTALGDTSQARPRRWSGKAGEGSGEGDMRSSALTVCQVLALEQRTEPWNELPAGNQACSLSYSIGTAAFGAFQGPNPSLLQPQGFTRREFACEKPRQ